MVTYTLYLSVITIQVSELLVRIRCLDFSFSVHLREVTMKSMLIFLVVAAVVLDVVVVVVVVVLIHQRFYFDDDDPMPMSQIHRYYYFDFDVVAAVFGYDDRKIDVT